MKSWNQRFVAYAREHGNTPEEQLESDAVRWPGGRMCGFQLWVSERWREWAALMGHSRAKDAYAILSQADHDAFDAWLETRNAS
jgi:hypothetical protein